MNKKKLIALCGKAGSGKDTLAHKICQDYHNSYHFVVSSTTRPPRDYEKDGDDYHFLTNGQFAEKVYNGEILEAVQFNGWFYGTDVSELQDDKINIGIFNPEGLFYLIDVKDLDIHIYYLDVSDKERMLRQLNRELNPNVAEIVRRYQADEDDFYNINELPIVTLKNEDERDMMRNYFRILKDWSNMDNTSI